MAAIKASFLKSIFLSAIKALTRISCCPMSEWPVKVRPIPVMAIRQNPTVTARDISPALITAFSSYSDFIILSNTKNPNIGKVN